jgi:hypothetical protein
MDVGMIYLLNMNISERLNNSAPQIQIVEIKNLIKKALLEKIRYIEVNFELKPETLDWLKENDYKVSLESEYIIELQRVKPILIKNVITWDY